MARGAEPKTQLFKDWKDEGRAEGRLEESRRLLLDLMDARGLRVDDVQRDLVLSCADPELLKARLRRAVLASSVDEVFAD